MVFPSVRGEQWSPYRGPGRFPRSSQPHFTEGLHQSQVLKQSREPHVQVVGSRCCEHDDRTRGAIRERCEHYHHLAQVVLAKEAGLSYAAIAMPTDYDCWKEGQVVDVTAVMKVMLLAGKDS